METICSGQENFLYRFKTFCFDLYVFGLTGNVPLYMRQLPDQIKLFCFVPDFWPKRKRSTSAKKIFCTNSKRFASIYMFFGLNRNVPLCIRQYLDQLKLVCFVPESLGQNGNDLLLMIKNLDQIKTVCFRSDLKPTKSKRFAFVPIISYDIGTFVLPFRYR